MDADHKFPAPPGTPLFQVSPERVNQQRFDLPKSPSLDLGSLSRHSRESSVQEKAARFESLAFQGKQLERRTNDAALRRAMLGREEAENEMRRYRDEVKNLRKQLEEGSVRERKVGERLEAVMDTYGRAKETHAHTQTLWEKEIRRARKESFKSQSAVVKLQEELKAMRNSLRMAQSALDQEKERCTKREQEAFTARYQLVGVQEELANMTENIKLVEQERDALRTIAKNEEIARIAAEGQLPLPSSSPADEFSSPRKASRSSLLPVTVMSAASEEEIERLVENLRWERNRAERAQEHADYLEMECYYRCCSCRRTDAKESADAVSTDNVVTEVDIQESDGEVVESDTGNVDNTSSKESFPQTDDPETRVPDTIFIPEEGIFRAANAAPEESLSISAAKETSEHQIENSDEPIVHINPFEYPAPGQARTPSCEPPSIATIQQSTVNLLSMLETRHVSPSTEAAAPTQYSPAVKEEAVESQGDYPVQETCQRQEVQQLQDSTIREMLIFRTISTTTRVPLSAPADFTPPSGNEITLEHPQFSPTMTREEALAQIRERRGRARSLAQGTLTPRKKMVEGAGPRRDISAPAARTGARTPSRGRNLMR